MALAESVERQCDGGPERLRLAGTEGIGRYGDYSLWFAGKPQPGVAAYVLVQDQSPCVLVFETKAVNDPFPYNLDGVPQLQDQVPGPDGWDSTFLNSGDLERRVVQQLLAGCKARGGSRQDCFLEADYFFRNRSVSLDIEPPSLDGGRYAIDVVDGRAFWEGVELDG